MPSPSPSPIVQTILLSPIPKPIISPLKNGTLTKSQSYLPLHPQSIIPWLDFTAGNIEACLGDILSMPYPVLRSGLGGGEDGKGEIGVGAGEEFPPSQRVLEDEEDVDGWVDAGVRRLIRVPLKVGGGIILRRFADQGEGGRGREITFKRKGLQLKNRERGGGVLKPDWHVFLRPGYLVPGSGNETGGENEEEEEEKDVEIYTDKATLVLGETKTCAKWRSWPHPLFPITGNRTHDPTPSGLGYGARGEMETSGFRRSRTTDGKRKGKNTTSKAKGKGKGKKQRHRKKKAATNTGATDWIWPWRQILTYCVAANTRYGFIITPEEVVVVRVSLSGEGEEGGQSQSQEDEHVDEGEEDLTSGTRAGMTTTSTTSLRRVRGISNRSKGKEILRDAATTSYPRPTTHQDESCTLEYYSIPFSFSSSPSAPITPDTHTTRPSPTASTATISIGTSRSPDNTSDLDHAATARTTSTSTIPKPPALTLTPSLALWVLSMLSLHPLHRHILPKSSTLPLNAWERLPTHPHAHHEATQWRHFATQRVITAQQLPGDAVEVAAIAAKENEAGQELEDTEEEEQEKEVLDGIKALSIKSEPRARAEKQQRRRGWKRKGRDSRGRRWKPY